MATTPPSFDIDDEIPVPEPVTVKEPQKEGEVNPESLARETYQAGESMENESGLTKEALLAHLTKLQSEADESRNQAIRAMAEMENIRRRAQEDVLKASKFAIENFAEQLLSVKDSLEMALANPNAEVAVLRQGVELTLKQLSQAFERAKVIEVASEGQLFDPNVHQAVSTVENGAPANTVVQVYQKGYRLNDRVLRPAMVVVAKA
jgi:molecular chaperone GrpE